MPSKSEFASKFAANAILLSLAVVAGCMPAQATPTPIAPPDSTPASLNLTPTTATFAITPPFVRPELPTPEVQLADVFIRIDHGQSWTPQSHPNIVFAVPHNDVDILLGWNALNAFGELYGFPLGQVIVVPTKRDEGSTPYARLNKMPNGDVIVEVPMFSGPIQMSGALYDAWIRITHPESPREEQFARSFAAISAQSGLSFEQYNEEIETRCQQGTGSCVRVRQDEYTQLQQNLLRKFLPFVAIQDDKIFDPAKEITK